jgi:hypothetical protein
MIRRNGRYSTCSSGKCFKPYLSWLPYKESIYHLERNHHLEWTDQMLGQFVLTAYPFTLICQAEMVATSKMAFDHKMSGIDACRRQTPVL